MLMTWYFLNLSGYPKLSLSRLTGKFGGQNGMILPIPTNAKNGPNPPQNAKKPPEGGFSVLLWLITDQVCRRCYVRRASRSHSAR